MLKRDSRFWIQKALPAGVLGVLEVNHLALEASGNAVLQGGDTY